MDKELEEVVEEVKRSEDEEIEEEKEEKEEEIDEDELRLMELNNKLGKKRHLGGQGDQIWNF